MRQSARVVQVVNDLQGEMRLRALVEKLLGHIQEITAAAYGTVYMYNCERQTLINTIMMESSPSSHVPIKSAGVGIVGYTARSGENLNLSDATLDPRYNRDLDEIQGTITHCCLTVAVVDHYNQVIAVLHLTNKMGGPFTTGDQTVVEELAHHLPGLLSRCLVYEQEVTEKEEGSAQLRNDVMVTSQRLEDELREKLNALGSMESKVLEMKAVEEQLTMEQEKRRITEEELGRAKETLAATSRRLNEVEVSLELVRRMDPEVHMAPLLRVMTSRLKEVLNAEYCRVLHVSGDKREFYDPLMDARLPFRGIAAYVAWTGETLCVFDAHNNSRFIAETDEIKGSLSQAILCAAIRNEGGDVVGVIHVINRTDRRPFSSEDVDLLTLMATSITAPLSRIQHHEASQRQIEEQVKSLEIDLTTAQASLKDKCKELQALEAELHQHKDAFSALESKREFDNQLLALSSMWGKHVDLTGLVKQMQIDVTRLLQVEGVVCYVVDRCKQELWSPWVEGDNITLRFDASFGFPGLVMKNKEVMVVDDAYKDRRFNRERDRIMSTITRNVLYGPLVDSDGEVIAIMEVFNRLGTTSGSFTTTDPDVFRSISSLAGLHLQRCLALGEERMQWEAHRQESGAVQDALQGNVRQANAVVMELQGQLETMSHMLSWTESLVAEASLPTLLNHVSHWTRKLLDCQYAQVFILDHHRQEFWTPSGGGGDQAHRIPLAVSGSLALISKTGKTMRIHDMATDPILSDEIMRCTGIEAKNMVATAVRDKRGHVTGVFQVGG